MRKFLKGRSKRKQSILTKQKVGKSSPAPSSTFTWSYAARTLLALLAITLIWAIGIRILDKTSQVFSYLNSLIVLSPNEWKIEVVASNGSPLPDDIKREVYKIASKVLRAGTPAELANLSARIESLGLLDGVRIIRPLSDTVILSANVRSPSLLIAAGNKTRFLTAEGTIYGDASDQSATLATSVPTVILTGIFDGKSNPSVDNSQRVQTTAEESSHIQDGIEIWQKSVEAGLDAKIINFQKFKGFSMTLADETEIVMGLKPFDYKFKKLRGIIDGLKRDGVIASRIELNYEGKAFIKEKKM